MKKFTSDGTGNSSLGASILDLAVNKEGTKIATVDDIGHITIYGVGSNDAHLAPREQFFETDYELVFNVFFSISIYFILLLFTMFYCFSFDVSCCSLIRISYYSALEYDANGFAIDSITELAPHLMRPPKLVKLDRDYLDEDWQKKVPGREVCSYTYFITKLQNKVSTDNFSFYYVFMKSYIFKMRYLYSKIFYFCEKRRFSERRCRR